MSKTKTKRVVASFLLLCLMSGTKAFASMPEGWNPGDDLATTNPAWIQDGNINITLNGFDGIFWDQASTSKAPVYIGGSNTDPVNVIFNGNNLIFRNNDTSLGYGGGAMYFGSPNWSFSDNNQTITINAASSFISNSTGAQDLVGSTPYGGAIYTTSKMEFNNEASFSQNKALGQQQADNYGGAGGAVYSNADLIFNKNVDFTGNEASVSGGAVYVGNQSVLTVKGGAKFDGNIAGSQGGAIYNANKVILDSSAGDITFINNTANSQANDIYLADRTNDRLDPAAAASSLTLQGDANTITFNGSILGDDTTSITTSANDLILNGNNAAYKGTYTQTGGTTTVGASGQFFGGQSTITKGDLILNAANDLADGSIILDSKNQKNYDDVNLYINANNTINGNVTGLGYIYNGNKPTNPSQDGRPATSTAEITLTGDNSGFKGTYYQDSGSGKLVVAENSKSFAGTNVITNAALKLNSGSTLQGTTIISTNADKTSTFVSNGAKITGPVDMYGNTDADLSGTTISNTFKVFGGTLDLNDGTVISTSEGAKGTLDVNGGIVNIKQDLTIGGDNNGVITSSNLGAGATAPVINMNNSILTILGDNSGYKGEFNKNGGQININGGKFFGGANNIENGVVNMQDDSSLAEGSTLQVNSGTTINIENTGADHNAATNNIPATTGNETVLSGAISSEVDKAGAINVTGENTYLVVDADMSDYTGSFTQDYGATTEVTANGVFFAGTNVLNDGHFIFRDNAQLGSDVTVASKDVHLAFGDGSQGYKVEDGNHVYYYNSDESRGEHSFIMNYVTITDSLDGGQGDYKVIDTDFGSNGGFANTADYDIKQQNDGSKTTISFRDGSVAQDGAQLNLADANTEININANYMEKHATSSSKDGVFGADISGIGTVNVNNTNSKDEALTFISDNSGFSGAYNQTGGSIRFEGQNGTSHFFDGENKLTNQSYVAFGADSVIHGTNYVDSTSTIVMENGSSIDTNDGDLTRIILQGGTLSIENTDKDNALDLNISVENNELGGNVNKTENRRRCAHN